jgi:hypothetical protein
MAQLIASGEESRSRKITGNLDWIDCFVLGYGYSRDGILTARFHILKLSSELWEVNLLFLEMTGEFNPFPAVVEFINYVELLKPSLLPVFFTISA